MYEKFFNFNARPFAAAPTPAAYFPGAAIEQGRHALIRTVERAEGPGLVIGAPGVGKTLLCRLLADHFESVVRVVHLSSTRIPTCKDLLQNILFELQEPYQDMDEGVLRLSLLDFLQPRRCPGGLLLLVDEAHELSQPSLDELLMLTNFVREGSPRVRLVLAGGTTLEEQFASPKCESFSQRVAARVYLEPFSRDETLQYVPATITSVGGDANLFQPDSLGAIYQATDGIPRLINQVCDHALVLACVAGANEITRERIEESWADLQQLPGPWQETSTATVAPSSVVEFGQLDEAMPSEDEHDRDEASSLVAVPAAGDREVEPSAVDSQVSREEPAESTPYDNFPALPASDTWSASDPPTTVDSVDVSTATPTTDPFAGDFEDEEVVIDRTASLQADVFRGRTAVTSDEGRELARAMSDDRDYSPAPLPDVIIEAQPEEAAVELTGAASQSASVDEPELPHSEPTTAPQHEPALEEEPQQNVPIVPTATAVVPHYAAPGIECTVFDTAAIANQSIQTLCEVDDAIVGLVEVSGKQPVTSPQPPTESERSTGEQQATSDASLDEAPVAVRHPATVIDDRDLLVVEEDRPDQTSADQARQLDYQDLFTQLRQGK